jgi:lon-related putative ATP-dependent protease
MSEKVKGLQVEQLYQACDPEEFDFETTRDVESLTEVIGQERAVEAMRFGLGIAQEGYNIFALGPSGMGKQSIIHRFFKSQAVEEPVPSDWCYVNNFEDSQKPNAIELPAGKGKEFREDMESLTKQFSTALSAAFESEEYQSRRQAITESTQEKQEEAFRKLQEKASEKGVKLVRTPAGLVVAPVHDGEALSPEELEDLPEEERQELKGKAEEIKSELQDILQQVPGWNSDLQEELEELNQEMAEIAVGGLIDKLRDKYADFPEVVEFLDAVQEDVVENAEDFLPSQNGQNQLLAAMQGRGQQEQRQESRIRKYKVNLIVDHSDSDHAPVIYEDNPTYQNLIGRIEHIAQMGALMTDFNLIRPGVLHQANGGYLLLDARKVLTQPYAWDALKRALQSGKVTIESLRQRLGLISTVSLEPEQIPLDVKVGLYGERMLYYLLYQLDPDFAKLFKVEADFQEEMDRTQENQAVYARLIATMADEGDLLPLDRSAVARVIERSSRMVSDREKLSTERESIQDLLKEANYFAGKEDSEVIKADHVQQAIDGQIHRADRIREKIQEMILRETLRIDTEGEAVGQVNGLSVLSLSNFRFGRPNRITARVRMGKGKVMDIEREVDLGGPVHSKGVLILSGFLGSRYAEETPLSLSASLVFEQSYSGIEGDSASSAELYALLSAIAEVPIQQNLAVTGSVDQHGQVQAIGGVNEKVEGFYDICQARGLTGDQGVLIPASNQKHLMLRQDVIEAVQEGSFHIYPVETVDQGIELITGMKAGARDEEGEYPEDSFNYAVEKRLEELAEKRSEFGKKDKNDEKEEQE